MKHHLIKLSMRASVVLLLLSFALFWSTHLFGQEYSATQKEILKMEKAWFEFMQKGDLARCETMMHKDGSFWFYSHKPADRGLFLAHWDHERIDSSEIKLPVVTIIGNIAIVHYFFSYTTRVIPDYQYPGRLTHIWMKQDGKWQMITAMNASCSHLPNCL